MAFFSDFGVPWWTPGRYPHPSVHAYQDPYYYRQQRLPADFHPVRTSHQAWPDFNLVPDHHAPSRHYAQEHDMHPEQYYSQLRDPHGQQALDYPSLLSRPPATARNAYPERERPAALSRYTQNRPGRSQDHPDTCDIPPRSQRGHASHQTQLEDLLGLPSSSRLSNRPSAAPVRAGSPAVWSVRSAAQRDSEQDEEEDYDDAENVHDVQMNLDRERLHKQRQLHDLHLRQQLLQERQRQALQEQRQREAYVERELQAQRELQTRRAAEHQLEQQQQEALLVALQQQGRRQQQKLREQERRLAQQQQAEQQAELERRMQQLWCAHLEQQNQYNKAGRKQDVAGTQAEQIDDALEHAFKQQQAQHAQQAAHQQRGRSLRGKDELLAQRAPQLQAEQLVQEAQQATQQQHGKSQQGEDEVLVQRACQLQAEQLTQQAQQAQQAQRAQQAQQTQRAQQAQRAELRHQQQVQHAAQQAFAQAAQQPQQHASHKSPHHDPEPEHAQRVHRMKTSPDEAAVCIQSHYKGYRIRSEKPMLNALAKANHKLTHIFSRLYQVESCITALQAQAQPRAKDGAAVKLRHHHGKCGSPEQLQKQLLELSELSMQVVLSMDELHSDKTEVRMVRKQVVKKALALMERIDNVRAGMLRSLLDSSHTYEPPSQQETPKQTPRGKAQITTPDAQQQLSTQQSGLSQLGSEAEDAPPDALTANTTEQSSSAHKSNAVTDALTANTTEQSITEHKSNAVTSGGGSDVQNKAEGTSADDAHVGAASLHEREQNDQEPTADVNDSEIATDVMTDDKPHMLDKPPVETRQEEDGTVQDLPEPEANAAD